MKYTIIYLVVTLCLCFDPCVNALMTKRNLTIATTTANKVNDSTTVVTEGTRTIEMKSTPSSANSTGANRFTKTDSQTNSVTSSSTPTTAHSVVPETTTVQDSATTTTELTSVATASVTANANITESPREIATSIPVTTETTTTAQMVTMNTATKERGTTVKYLGTSTIFDAGAINENDSSENDTSTTGMSPALTAVVCIACSFLFVILLLLAVKFIRNLKRYQFRRLLEVPMDDFEDYSGTGVYAEHTVPIRNW